jgi:hypothetical protein
MTQCNKAMGLIRQFSRDGHICAPINCQRLASTRKANMKNLRTHITRFLIVAAALICGYFTMTTGRTAGVDSTKNSARPTPDLRGPAAIRHLEQTGLYNSLSAAVTAARYQIEARQEGGHEAANPKQGYRTVFAREGVEVRGSSRTGGKWRLGMKLTAYGYGERKKAAPSADVKAKDDRIEYERRASDGGAISEWYVNRASGLEQGFTIAQAPGKRRAGEKLNLWLKLSGDLKARLGERGQAILLNGRGTGAGLRYDKLHAFDATGREIEARMKLAGDQIRIEVADEGAIYPVTIDPTLTQQQKLEPSDAGESDNFGSSVAISGDTVVIGSPLDDGAAGVDQGSAYVFAPPANQPPNCSGAFPSVDTIWPPNHDMVNVTIQGVTDPDGDPVTINIDQIKQDEPTDGTGDGHTCPDGAGIGTSTAQVRAERSAQGDGRVYTIYFTASDGAGGSCQGSVTVCVPKSGNGSCTNSGANFDSTQCDTSLIRQSGDSVTAHWPPARKRGAARSPA